MFWLLFLYYVNSSKNVAKEQIKRYNIEISILYLVFCDDISTLCPNKARCLPAYRNKRICRRQGFGRTEYSVR